MAEEALAITIVDDDPAVLDSLQTIFEVEGLPGTRFRRRRSLPG
jgi:FixJ family two-component response regulator